MPAYTALTLLFVVPMRTPAVPSPCILECRIDQNTGFCRGCGRTLSEISYWTRLTDAERATIMAALPARREANPNSGPVGA